MKETMGQDGQMPLLPDMTMGYSNGLFQKVRQVAAKASNVKILLNLGNRVSSGASGFSKSVAIPKIRVVRQPMNSSSQKAAVGSGRRVLHVNCACVCRLFFMIMYVYICVYIYIIIYIYIYWYLYIYEYIVMCTNRLWNVIRSIFIWF